MSKVIILTVATSFKEDLRAAVDATWVTAAQAGLAWKNEAGEYLLKPAHLGSEEYVLGFMGEAKDWHATTFLAEYLRQRNAPAPFAIAEMGGDKIYFDSTQFTLSGLEELFGELSMRNADYCIAVDGNVVEHYLNEVDCS